MQNSSAITEQLEIRKHVGFAESIFELSREVFLKTSIGGERATTTRIIIMKRDFREDDTIVLFRCGLS